MAWPAGGPLQAAGPLVRLHEPPLQATGGHRGHLDTGGGVAGANGLCAAARPAGRSFLWVQWQPVAPCADLFVMPVKMSLCLACTL